MTDLCHRCGQCCTEPDGTPCKYLMHGNHCMIYEHRLNLNPRCIDIEKAKEQGRLPGDCGYVNGREGVGVQ